jgi:hypothetical protein
VSESCQRKAKHFITHRIHTILNINARRTTCNRLDSAQLQPAFCDNAAALLLFMSQQSLLAAWQRQVIQWPQISADPSAVARRTAVPEL